MHGTATRTQYLFRSAVMIIKEIELLQAVIFELIFLGGSVKVGHGIYDALEPRLVIRVFGQSL